MLVVSLGRRTAYGTASTRRRRSPTTLRALDPLYLTILVAEPAARGRDDRCCAWPSGYPVAYWLGAARADSAGATRC